MSIKRINEFPEGSGSLSSDDIFLFMDNPSASGATKKIALSEINNIISVDRLVNGNKQLVLETDGSLILPTSGNITSGTDTAQVGYRAVFTQDFYGNTDTGLVSGSTVLNVGSNAQLLALLNPSTAYGNNQFLLYNNITITYSDNSTQTFSDCRCTDINGSVLSFGYNATTAGHNFPITLQTSNYVAATTVRQWTFGTDGKLTLPTNGSITFPNGSIQTTASSSTVGTGANSIIAGGINHTAGGISSTVGGGNGNEASASASTVGGGYSNSANGTNSTVAGGGSNEAGSPGSTISGGSSNIASYDNTTIGGGTTNTASGWAATVCGGESNISSGNSAVVAGGYDNTASGNYSVVAGGFKNTASGEYSCVTGGQYASAPINNSRALASGRFGSASFGNAQMIEFVLRGVTTGAESITATLDGSAARDSWNMAAIPASTTWAFTVKVAAYSVTDNVGAAWDITGALRRNASTAPVIIGTNTTVTVTESALSTATCTVVADATYNAIRVIVTGVASKTIRWAAHVTATQVTNS